jgi:uncharacterized protein
MHQQFSDSTPPPIPPAVPPASTSFAGPAEWERTYALFTHLTLLLVLVPIIPVLPPLIMWLIKRDRSPFVDAHGKEAVNFSISLVLYAIGVSIAIFVLAPLTCGAALLVLWPAYLAVWVLGAYGMVMAVLAAKAGRLYRYPLTIRLV